MEIAQDLYEFFEIGSLSTTATFLDAVQLLLQIGISVWIVMFIIKCLFMACTIGDRRFF